MPWSLCVGVPRAIPGSKPNAGLPYLLPLKTTCLQPDYRIGAMSFHLLRYTDVDSMGLRYAKASRSTAGKWLYAAILWA